MSASLPLSLADGLSREYLIHHRVCPLCFAEDGRVVVAVAPDALLEDALDDIAFSYRRPAVAEEHPSEEVERLIERLTTASERLVELERIEGTEDEFAADVRDLANQPPVVRYVNLLVRDAYEAGASDIHLEATRSGLSARFRLDGVLAPAPEPPGGMHHAVVSRIKLLAELDIAERRRPQDGRIRVRLESRELDLRVSTVPTMFGESVVLRLLDRGGPFFAADGSLRMVDSRAAAHDHAQYAESQQYAVEDYRYDALGRRVWVRARKSCMAPTSRYAATECRSSLIRRTIWDGDQELAEIQMPWSLQGTSFPHVIAETPTWWENDTLPVSLPVVAAPGPAGAGDPNPLFGHVIYAGLLGIDQPIAVTRVNYVWSQDWNYPSTAYTPTVKLPFTIVPFWDPRGDARGGVVSNGVLTVCDPPTGYLKCVGIHWPWDLSSGDRQGHVQRGSWHGTVLESKRDKSGFGYMRNRYYDPAVGRFTQEDPAGAANTYGFAGGDPVNYHDPFGLWCQKRGEHELYCEDLYPGDFRTIRDFLGGEAGRSSYETFTAAGFTQWRPGTCRGGFETDQCDRIADALSNLILKIGDLCSELGTAATKRFQRGGIKWRPGGKDYGRAFPWWFPPPWHNTTRLYGPAFAPGELAETIAHEEAHHRHPFAHHAYAWVAGRLCRGSI